MGYLGGKFDFGVCLYGLIWVALGVLRARISLIWMCVEQWRFQGALGVGGPPWADSSHGKARVLVSGAPIIALGPPGTDLLDPRVFSGP